MAKVFTFPLESNLNKDKNRSTSVVGGFFEVCAPTGIRTPVVALKGLRPSPLDDGGNRSGSGRILSFPNATVKQITVFPLLRVDQAGLIHQLSRG